MIHNLLTKMPVSDNPFILIEQNAQVPERLKNALLSEIDTIRNTSTIVELFVGNFINVLTASFSIGSNVEEKDLQLKNNI